MTLKERVIVETYTGTCMITGGDREELYKYWAELMGRPVYTHEIASKEIQEQLQEKSKADFVALCRSDGETDSRAAKGDMLMNDLISRGKVIEVLKETGIIADDDRRHLAIQEIERIPVAFDVEAVCKKLWMEAEGVCGYEMVDVDTAGEIIRSGGI